MSKDNDDSKIGKAVAKLLTAVIMYLVYRAFGYTESVSDYPINIDAPSIYDGDSSVVVNDFSIVYITTDKKAHVCYEKTQDGITRYYDLEKNRLLDPDCIVSVEAFEKVIKEHISVVKGLAKKDELDKEIDKTFEENGVKVMTKEN